MDAEFLGRIERPRTRSLERLRDRAIENVKDALPQRSVEVHDDAVFRKLAFTYYYDWSTDDPQFMLVGEDPGAVGSRHTSDLIDFVELPSDATLAQIGLYRGFAARWLADDNHRFSETFFGTCSDEGLIVLDRPVRQYIRSESMYEAFYLTDVNKYRAMANAAETWAALAAAFTADELYEINPDLIFCFGNTAWNALQRELALEPLHGEQDPNAGITQFDGRLFRSRRLIDTHVIPLLHMSGNAFGARRTPAEYSEKLAGGLRTWQKL